MRNLLPCVGSIMFTSLIRCTLCRSLNSTPTRVAFISSTSSRWALSTSQIVSTKSSLHLRKDDVTNDNVRKSDENKRQMSTSSSSETSTKQEYVTLAQPAPGSPFHLALPVHNLEIAKDFYGNILGCEEGRSSAKWQDYSLNGHQIVCHWVGEEYRCQDYFNPVDGDDIPVPHFGLALTEAQFHELSQRVRDAGIPFIVEPHLRFKGQPGMSVYF